MRMERVYERKKLKSETAKYMELVVGKFIFCVWKECKGELNLNE